MTRLELPMTAMFLCRVAIGFAMASLLLAGPALAESQGTDYRGINDPFGDPSNYEFAEDEREDKEFFHLGRFLMIGFDVGLGAFTGGLGGSVNPAASFSGRILYFFDKSIAIEFGGGFAQHLDQVRGAGNSGVDADLSITNLSLGLRYYFDVKDAPKAIAVANPYLAVAPGMYLLSLQPVTSVGMNADYTDDQGFGIGMGGGVEFNIYRRHVFVGLDLRYHLVFFPSEASTYGGALPEGARAGDYFRAAATFTYNF
jgi:hypothetical protein